MKNKQTSFNVFVFVFQIKSWPNYNAIGSHDLFVPIPVINELGKTTTDHKCRKHQFS